MFQHPVHDDTEGNGGVPISQRLAGRDPNRGAAGLHSQNGKGRRQSKNNNYIYTCFFKILN